MSELLIEIYSEEIPARMQLQAQADFKSLWESALNKKNASFKNIETYVAPQRLVVYVNGLDGATKGTTETRRGPKTNAPETALAGFLKSTGKTKDQLSEKDGYWYAEISESGKDITKLLSEMLDEVIDSMPWPKTMRWYNHQTKSMSKSWIRPVRSILCVYDGKPVNFNVIGFGVDTGNVTYGHRFLAPDALAVTSFADYKNQLEKSFVILCHQDRQAMIKKLISEQTASKGLQLKEDQGLLEEVAGLVDYPFAHLGEINKDFIHLPGVVLSTSMKVHQKYFTIVDAKGDIAPFFGVITNVPAKANDRAMLDGLERVLRARLADASFFYEVDMKNDWRMKDIKLEHIVFHAKLGSLGQKVRRLEQLMTTGDGKRAAFLCKLDLVTEMVGEFPELQGIMGEIYATTQGEKPEVAAALREYYLPQGPSDLCPTAPISVELALMDKLDTLFGFIGIGMKPTGSKDPIGLRRAALGIIRLYLDRHATLAMTETNERHCEERMRRGKPVTLDGLLNESHDLYKKQLGEIKFANTFSPTAIEDTKQFIFDRLKVYLRDQGIEHDCVDAVLSAESNTDNLWSIAERAKALQSLLNTDAGVTLKAAYKRASGILSNTPGTQPFNVKLLNEPAEQALYESLSTVQKDYQNHLEQHQYQQVMTLLALLRGHIDTFFDNVTVNCEDQALRENRYRLLHKFVSLVNQVADFSKLQG